MNRKILAGAALLLLGTTAAMAQLGANSTNGYTAAQRTAAEAAVKAAGYTPGAVLSAQGGAIFIHGTKDGQPYLLTVSQDGKVYASAGSTAPMPLPPPGAAPAGRGGRGGRGG
jgi:hypothetical protein